MLKLDINLGIDLEPWDPHSAFGTQSRSGTVGRAAVPGYGYGTRYALRYSRATRRTGEDASFDADALPFMPVPMPMPLPLMDLLLVPPPQLVLLSPPIILWE